MSNTASPAANSVADQGGGDQSSAASAAESTGKGDSGSGNGSGSGDAGSAESIANKLEPPNAQETSRTTSGGLVLVTYESTDSMDSLSSFYEQAIRDAGMDVMSKTTVADGTNWIFGSADISASVTIQPSGDTSGGTTVAITVTDTSV